MNIPETNLPRVVIIGGGFGGLHLGKALKNKRFQVVMLDKNNYHTFQPLLYQVATAGLEPDSIAYPLRKIFKNHREFYFRMAEVAEIHPEEKTISTDIGKLNYDYLVIANGASTNFFGNKDIQQHAVGMKSVSEALDIRSILLQNFEKALLTDSQQEQEALMTFTIVGGGPTGVELAGAFAELKKHILPADYPDLDIRRMKIHLIEMQNELLGPMSAIASKKAKDYLERMGVTLWLEQAVQSFDGKKVVFQSGKELLTETLIWAAGVKGNLIKGIDESKVERGRYKVNAFNQVEGFEDIFAIGDIALMKTEAFPHGLPMVAPVANQQGILLGKNLLKLEAKKEPAEFKYNDQGSMATVGRNRAVADLGKLKFQGTMAWFVWMFVHLMTLVGFRNRIVTLFNWIYSYLNFDRGIRLIIRKFNK